MVIRWKWIAPSSDNSESGLINTIQSGCNTVAADAEVGQIQGASVSVSLFITDEKIYLS